MTSLGVNGHRARKAARVMHGGGVIAYPTEAVYGLGCDPFDGRAVRRVLASKVRDANKGLILIAADVAQLHALLAEDEVHALSAHAAQLDGDRATTWVVKKKHSVPDWLSGGRDTIAVRVTTHGLARDLCLAFGGPIVSTSANLSGKRPARRVVDVARRLGGRIDWCVGGRVGNDPRPSRIIDLSSGRMLRD